MCDFEYKPLHKLIDSVLDSGLDDSKKMKIYWDQKTIKLVIVMWKAKIIPVTQKLVNIKWAGPSKFKFTYIYYTKTFKAVHTLQYNFICLSDLVIFCHLFCLELLQEPLHLSDLNLNQCTLLGAIHKLHHTNFMIFLPFPRPCQSGHSSEIPPPPPSVTSHIYNFTPRNS